MKTGFVSPKRLNPSILFSMLMLNALLTLTACFNLRVGIVEYSPVLTQDAMVTPQRTKPTTIPYPVEPTPAPHTAVPTPVVAPDEIQAARDEALATETWVLAGSLATARLRHTATLLSEGRVLVVGGTQPDSHGPGLASAEIYDPVSGVWSTTRSLNHARQQHTTTLLPDGRVLVVGGGDYDGGWLASAEIYDPVSGTWSPAAPLSVPRRNHTATLLSDGRVLVVGGSNGDNYHASVEVYDPVSGTWSPTGSLTIPRHDHSATLLPDGRVLVVGGYDGGWLASAEIYNPASGTWSATDSLSCHGVGHTATLLTDGRVLAVGGACGSGKPGVRADAEIYDPASGIWSPTAAIPTVRVLHTATLLPNGRVLVAGGANGAGLRYDSALIYDPASGVWSPTGSLAAARRYHTATLLADGRVLVAGGWGNNNDCLDSAEIYVPRFDPEAMKETIEAVPPVTATPSAPSVDLNDGLVAYYSFDESEGNVLHDLSGNGNDGMIYGARWVDGKYGKALSFDGTDDYVDCGNNESLNFGTGNFTVEAWFRTSTTGPHHKNIVCKIKRNGNWQGFESKLERGQIRACLQASDGTVCDNRGSNVHDGTWKHLVSVWDRSNGEARVYINGEQQGTPIDVSSKTGSIDNDNPLTIGCRSDMADIHYFRGTIDEVRIYKRALTGDEIKADMLSHHPELMEKSTRDTISKTKAITEQLEKEGIDTSAIEELIASARSALQREAYQVAFEQAQEASLRTGEVWDAFQNYSSIREEVEVKIDQLKKEGVDTSVIERTLLEAEDAVGKGDVELAEQLVSDGDARANKAWQGFEDIENARDKTSEVKELGCDVVDAENRIDDAVDALNKGSYDIVEQYAQEAISLANKASCGEIGISDLKALAVRYDGKRIVISGKVGDIETLYGEGYRFTIDDGTGLIMVEYEGSVREIDSGDNVAIKGVFFRSNEVIAAHEVETSGIDAFLWGNFDLILVSVICVVATIGIMAISGGTILYVRSTRKG